MSRGSLKYILPEDAIVLRAATQRACARANITLDLDRDHIADAVLWLAECGYARRSDGTLDPGMLAEAAITQFWNRRLRPVNETHIC